MTFLAKLEGCELSVSGFVSVSLNIWRKPICFIHSRIRERESERERARTHRNPMLESLVSVIVRPGSPSSLPSLGRWEPLNSSFSSKVSRVLFPALSTRVRELTLTYRLQVLITFVANAKSTHFKHTPHFQAAAHKKELYLIIHEGKYSWTQIAMRVQCWAP